MYIIKSDGQTVALQEQPRYIRTNPASGAYIESDEEHAEGIAANGLPFNLPGHTEITRQVFVPGETEDEGTVVTETAPEAQVLSEDLLLYVKGLEDTNSALEEDLTNTQLALVEVYEMIGG